MTYPAFPGPYATATDLGNYWRGLSSGEQSQATVLLAAAADRINEMPGARNFVVSACHWVSLDMVMRAMIGRASGGEKSESQSMAGMSVTRQFANPMGTLYVTGQESNRLRGQFGCAAGSVVLSSNVRVPLQPWNFQYPPLDLPYVSWMTVCPAAMTLTVGVSRHLMVLAVDRWEYEDRTNYAQFTTSDATVATVDDVGLVRAIHSGTATITAAYEGFTAVCAVTVS